MTLKNILYGILTILCTVMGIVVLWGFLGTEVSSVPWSTYWPLPAIGLGGLMLAFPRTKYLGWGLIVTGLVGGFHLLIGFPSAWVWIQRQFTIDNRVWADTFAAQDDWLSYALIIIVCVSLVGWLAVMTRKGTWWAAAILALTILGVGVYGVNNTLGVVSAQIEEVRRPAPPTSEPIARFTRGGPAEQTIFINPTQIGVATWPASMGRRHVFFCLVVDEATYRAIPGTGAFGTDRFIQGADGRAEWTPSNDVRTYFGSRRIELRVHLQQDNRRPC